MPRPSPAIHALAIGAALFGVPVVAHAAGHRVLHAFRGGSDGAYPLAGLIAIGTRLYGTTSGGGVFNDGTVFTLSAGSETVLHAFTGGNDGSTPTASLTDMDGTLYGTTYLGGGSTGCPSGCGTVFSVNPASGAEAMIYAFKGYLNGDGAYPLAGLLGLNGALYGTTASGGSVGGVVFSLAPAAGVEIQVQSIGLSGSYPEAALVNVAGTLYGTAYSGGDFQQCEGNGCGTTYAWNPVSSALTSLHAFQDTPDGANPVASLLYLGGNLYGTTFLGGASRKGAVVVINLATGAERVLYAFKGGSDGAYPAANLINVGDVLYGTTSQGGTSATCLTTGGCGAVFSIDLNSGTEQVVYAFGGGSDGETPEAGLINAGGTLYGTTAYGGDMGNCSNGGCGTVFSLTH